jgi:hypothetical protein
MDNTRFLAALNASIAESGLDLSVPASPRDPQAVAAWAGFLRACVARGVTIADPRWQHLVLRSAGSASKLVLVDADDTDAPDAGEVDFRLGLSLFMSLLGGDVSDPPGQ